MTTKAAGPGFSLTVSRVLGRILVTGHGTLDGAGCTTLDRILRDLIDGQGNLTVVVDLADVTVCRLECAGVLLAAADAAARRGGEVAVVGATDLVAWALEAARLEGHIAVTGEIAKTP